MPWPMTMMFMVMSLCGGQRRLVHGVAAEAHGDRAQGRCGDEQAQYAQGLLRVAQSLHQEACCHRARVAAGADDAGTPPSARLSMNGTSAYVAPQAMWVNRPKPSMAMTANMATSTCENSSRPMPSPIISTNSSVTRLFRLPRAAALSDSKPKLPAAMPADCSEKPKCST